MSKGGYTILDLSDVTITFGTAATLPKPALNARDSKKVLLVSGLKDADGNVYSDFFVNPVTSGGLYVGTLGGVLQSGTASAGTAQQVSIFISGNYDQVTISYFYGDVLGTGVVYGSSPTEKDLNNYKTPGSYIFGTSTIVGGLSNCPSSVAGKLTVEAVGTTSGVPSRFYQFYKESAPAGTAPVIYCRYFNGTTWSSWYTMDITVVS